MHQIKRHSVWKQGLKIESNMFKSMIHAKEGFRPDQFSLVYDGGKLLEDDRTLASLNMRNELTLYLIFCPEDVLSIFVKAPNEETVKLETKAQFTARDIKGITGSMIGVPAIGGKSLRTARPGFF